jgi:deazaflavin-dependent oxidoreductase (nitroreductase family)
MTRPPDEIADQLTEWGRVVRIETVGRITGRRAAAAVGFIEAPDGSLLVAAGDPGADWALNLEADSSCTVTVGGRTWAAKAEPLEAEEAARTVGALILRYGTPAERLGRGPAFRIRPVAR